MVVVLKLRFTSESAGGLVKADCCASDLVYPGWGVRICVFGKCSGNVAVLAHTPLRAPALQTPLQSQPIKPYSLPR